jgi:hypothetical protein
MPRTRRFWKTAALCVAMFVSFLLLFPISAELADPYFTRPFNPKIPQCVLLIWPDRVEARWVDNISEVSPRPHGAQYSFLIPAARENWVREQLKSQPVPPKDAGWLLRVRDTAPNRQEIRLEMMGDGYLGLIYEATPDQIVPLQSRDTGPGGAFLVLFFDLAIFGGGWLLLWAVWSLLKRRRRNYPGLIA